MLRNSRHRIALLAAVLVTSNFGTAFAASIVRRAGEHPHYSIEVEPHLVWTYAWQPPRAHDGVGIGLRASVPLFHNGPIDTINNNMAISFGLDWAHAGVHCGPTLRPPPGYPPDYYAYYGDDTCTANGFWFPVTLQWNFFLTPVISVFGEPGAALVHERWSQWVACPAGAGPCSVTFSHNEFHPVLWGGARFMFNEMLGVTVRLGVPSMSAGLSLLL